MAAPTATRMPRLSLASATDVAIDSGAFARAVEENRPEIAQCRAILQTAPGKRSLDAIRVIDKLFQAIQLMVYTEPKAHIFDEGDAGERFYLVFRGQVEITKQIPDLSASGASDATTSKHIAFLHPGDAFGERALLYESDRRAASAIVISDTAELIFISRRVFQDLLQEMQDADVSGNSLEVSKRFRSNKDIVRNIFVRDPAQRSDKDLTFAVEYLKGVRFFARFSFEVRKQICRAMKLLSAVTNTVLFEEGQPGRHFYIIFTGSVEVTVRATNRFEETKESVVSRLGEGECFGELALSEEDGVRRATVTCSEFCELLVLGRDEYGPLIKKYQSESHDKYAQLLRQNPYFAGAEWDAQTVEQVCAVMAEKHFPYRAEICKQGSRAAEMFIITRGECIVVHTGKHPITHAPQEYILGRYGPGSVLGAVEASTGNFNDIVLRRYAILAESPVNLLVLSRFDIFHLMSPEARASLLESARRDERETVESRALKTIVWERYRKDFLGDILAARHDTHATTMIQNEGTHLGKSVSAPTLHSRKRLQPLVPCGMLSLETRRYYNGTHERAPVLPTEACEDDSHSATTNAAKKSDPCTSIGPLSAGSSFSNRRHTVDYNSVGSTGTTHAQAMPSLEEGVDEHDHPLSPLPSPAKSPKKILTKSQTAATLEPTRLGSYAFALPKMLGEKPLYPPDGSSNESRGMRVRAETPQSMKSPSGATTSWDAILGVSRPFALVGFARETPNPTKTPSSPSSMSTRVSEPIVTALRVFGIFLELNDAMDLFRRVCLLETIPIEGKDTRQFAIYKDGEMTVSLQNFFSDENSQRSAGDAPRQFSSVDLADANGQRFACVRVTFESPARRIESVQVRVLHCFPTFQSAVRFAKQWLSVTVPIAVLYVLPVFEWIPLSELDHFDAKNVDLEQALESVCAASKDAPSISTWKARKEALKKARARTISPQ